MICIRCNKNESVFSRKICHECLKVESRVRAEAKRKKDNELNNRFESLENKYSFFCVTKAVSEGKLPKSEIYKTPAEHREIMKQLKNGSYKDVISFVDNLLDKKIQESIKSP